MFKIENSKTLNIGSNMSKRLTSGSITADCPSSDGWIYHRGTDLCYKRSSFKTNITDAERLCAAEQGRLIVVDTAEKNELLLKMHPTSGIGSLFKSSSSTYLSGVSFLMYTCYTDRFIRTESFLQAPNP